MCLQFMMIILIVFGNSTLYYRLPQIMKDKIVYNSAGVEGTANAHQAVCWL